MKLPTIIGSCILFMLLTDVVSFFSPAAPWGTMGGLSYINRLSEPGGRDAYEVRIAEMAKSMYISVASCATAQSNFRKMGGDAGIRRRFFNEQMHGYDRSMAVWPSLFGIMTFLIAASVWGTLRREVSWAKQRSEICKPQQQQSRNDAVNKLLFK